MGHGIISHFDMFNSLSSGREPEISLMAQRR